MNRGLIERQPNSFNVPAHLTSATQANTEAIRRGDTEFLRHHYPPPPKFEGIGPESEKGLPTALRSVGLYFFPNEENQEILISILFITIHFNCDCISPLCRILRRISSMTGIRRCSKPYTSRKMRPVRIANLYLCAFV